MFSSRSFAIDRRVDILRSPLDVGTMKKALLPYVPVKRAFSMMSPSSPVCIPKSSSASSTVNQSTF